MESGRFGSQQRWDSNSALEGYCAVSQPNLRVGGSCNGRRNLDDGLRNDHVYQRESFHQGIHDRDVYQSSAPIPSNWSQSRKNVDEEFEPIRDSRRHEKIYPDSFQEKDHFRGPDRFHDSYHDADSYHNNSFEDSFENDNYHPRYRCSRHIRENSHDKDHDFGRYSYDSDYEREGRENSGQRYDSRGIEKDKRGSSYERDLSPHRRWRHSRSRSRGHDDCSRSRSPRGRSHGRSRRDGSYDGSRCDRIEKWRDYDHEDKQHYTSAGPSPTVVVKGLSPKTTEEDLFKILTDWGPLHHVRVIRERNSGKSRGFAFIDFPTLGSASNMMNAVGDGGIILDGRKIFFEYSSKPTGSGGLGQENTGRSGHFRSNVPSDWMCTICGCLNFARRTSCFQCNEPRTDDAPSVADVSSVNLANAGRKGSDSGPTHVLVVRGLDENADDEMLRYEFSKHAPIKDIRLVRDKFTHVSRGFGFVHFHSIDDATRALEATNGTKFERNGQVLRVAYAKSIHGPSVSGGAQSSSLAAAAIEAASFAQQYDSVGWAPKEYNSDDKQPSGLDQNQETIKKNGSAPQSGFVWDETSGYYYDAASGFYYDGNTGLYYDGNNGTWFSYDHEKQQYVQCTDPNDNQVSGKSTKSLDEPSKRKAVISAPAATILSKEKTSLPDAVQAAAAAALASEKKAKERTKEIKLASKSSILASKKKMSNVLTMWKQRNHEGQTARVVIEDSQTPSSSKNKYRNDSLSGKESFSGSGVSSSTGSEIATNNSSISAITDSQPKQSFIGNSSRGNLMGVIRSSDRGVVKSDTKFSSKTNTSDASMTYHGSAPSTEMPFRTHAAALGSYTSTPTNTTGKRRFSEAPTQPTAREQPQTGYRDRAAERRSLYGSSSSIVGEMSDLGVREANRDFSHRRGSSSDLAMPFPPGVGGGHVTSDTLGYEVVTADRAIDDSNVGNRMLRNMGWQEGSGLGKHGSGITEPVQAQGMEERAGLGRHQRKVVDKDLEVQAGDTYRTLIQKKAIARFREMN